MNDIWTIVKTKITCVTYRASPCGLAIIYFILFIYLFIFFFGGGGGPGRVISQGLS